MGTDNQVILSKLKCMRESDQEHTVVEEVISYYHMQLVPIPRMMHCIEGRMQCGSPLIAGHVAASAHYVYIICTAVAIKSV